MMVEHAYDQKQQSAVEYVVLRTSPKRNRSALGATVLYSSSISSVSLIDNWILKPCLHDSDATRRIECYSFPSDGKRDNGI